MSPSNNLWSWNDRTFGWSLMGDADAEEAVLLIQGLGRSDQPRTPLKDEPVTADAVHDGFDLWGQQMAISTAR